MVSAYEINSNIECMFWHLTIFDYLDLDVKIIVTCIEHI